MEALPTIIAVALPLLELLGILAAVHAVMNTRTSQGAIAWAIALVTLPFVTLIPYAIFGRNKFQGYVSLRSRQDARLHHLLDRFQAEARDKDLLRPPVRDADKALVGLARMPIMGGNTSQLLINGPTTFAQLFEDIDAARNYVLVEFYIVNDDHLGGRLKNRLIRKAQEGVSVYFLYDELGSYKLPGSYLREMTRAGIAVSAFHSTRGRTNHFQLNFRNHRKIVVIDGAIAYVGGAQRGGCLSLAPSQIRTLARHPRQDRGAGRQGRSILLR